jgi:hypothetical protein
MIRTATGVTMTVAMRVANRNCEENVNDMTATLNQAIVHMIRGVKAASSATQIQTEDFINQTALAGKEVL